MRAILTKQYDTANSSPEVDICKRRQDAVSRQVRAHVGLWGGVATMGGLCFWSLRRYNYQARLIAIPFLAYAGAFVGKAVGDMLTCRNQEHGRDRFLAQLPAKGYYHPAE